jgi:hypothetical protein
MLFETHVYIVMCTGGIAAHKVFTGLIFTLRTSRGYLLPSTVYSELN